VVDRAATMDMFWSHVLPSPLRNGLKGAKCLIDNSKWGDVAPEQPNLTY